MSINKNNHVWDAATGLWRPATAADIEIGGPGEPGGGGGGGPLAPFVAVNAETLNLRGGGHVRKHAGSPLMADTGQQAWGRAYSIGGTLAVGPAVFVSWQGRGADTSTTATVPDYDPVYGMQIDVPITNSLPNGYPVRGGGYSDGSQAVVIPHAESIHCPALFAATTAYAAQGIDTGLGNGLQTFDAGALARSLLVNVIARTSAVGAAATVRTSTKLVAFYSHLPGEIRRMSDEDMGPQRNQSMTNDPRRGGVVGGWAASQPVNVHQVYAYRCKRLDATTPASTVILVDGVFATSFAWTETEHDVAKLTPDDAPVCGIAAGSVVTVEHYPVTDSVLVVLAMRSDVTA